jgi:hypothetical protein
MTAKWSYAVPCSILVNTRRMECTQFMDVTPDGLKKNLAIGLTVFV